MNIKSQHELTITKLETYELTKRDIVNLEKIILKRIQPSDHFVEVGKRKGLFRSSDNTYSGARYIPKLDKTFSYLEIITKSPNISVTFTPRTTSISVPRRYYKDELLKQLDEAAAELKKYLETRTSPSNLFRRNAIRL